MKGYNSSRTYKPSQRSTKAKVLTVLNSANAWTRVSHKSIEFYKEHLSVAYSRDVSEHRTEFYNADNKCVMVYEF